MCELDLIYEVGQGGLEIVAAWGLPCIAFFFFNFTSSALYDMATILGQSTNDVKIKSRMR